MSNYLCDGNLRIYQSEFWKLISLVAFHLWKFVNIICEDFGVHNYFTTSAPLRKKNRWEKLWLYWTELLALLFCFKVEFSTMIYGTNYANCKKKDAIFTASGYLPVCVDVEGETTNEPWDTWKECTEKDDLWVLFVAWLHAPRSAYLAVPT